MTVCSFHHRFVHEHGWQITPAAAGTFRFAPPGRSPLPTARPLPGVTAQLASPDPGAISEDRPLRPTAYWPPHNLDLNLAISVLHQELDAIARDTIPPMAA